MGKVSLAGLLYESQGASAVLHCLLGDDALGDIILGWEVKHDLQHQFFQDDPEAPGADIALDGLVGDRPDRPVNEAQLDVFVLEEALVLLDQRILGFREDLDEGGLVQVVERGRPRPTPWCCRPAVLVPARGSISSLSDKFRSVWDHRPKRRTGLRERFSCHRRGPLRAL